MYGALAVEGVGMKDPDAIPLKVASAVCLFDMSALTLSCMASASAEELLSKLPFGLKSTCR